jgi:hypothetical protein
MYLAAVCLAVIAWPVCGNATSGRQSAPNSLISSVHNLLRDGLHSSAASLRTPLVVSGRTTRRRVRRRPHLAERRFPSGKSPLGSPAPGAEAGTHAGRSSEHPPACAASNEATSPPKTLAWAGRQVSMEPLPRQRLPPHLSRPGSGLELVLRRLPLVSSTRWR